MKDDPVITAALLGASRPDALPPPPDPRLSAAWEALSTAEPATAMLGALAVSRALRMAGVRPGAAAEAPEPAPDDPREVLSENALDGLLRMLGGEFREVLPEWLRHADGVEAVAPPRVLPELLDAGRRDARLRPALARLCGERGRWLARRRPDFEWLLSEGGIAEDGWDAERPAERLAWLREARRTDPGGCALRIDEMWAGESPDFREAVTRIAASEPFPEDEIWLESKALVERRQATRRLATGALAQIAGSGFARRAIARLRPLVGIRKKLLRQVITAVPPETFDPSWAEDGLVEKAPAGTGNKAWWLRQLVAAIPPARWAMLLGEDAWLKLGIESDWREPLVLGWIDAALAAPASACADQLLPWLAKLDPWPSAAPPRRAVMVELFGALDPPARARLFEDLVPLLPGQEAIGLLAALADDPPPPGNTALAVIRKAVAAKPAVLTRPDARSLALCIPPASIGLELERLAKLPELSAAAEEFATTLEFRRKLFTTS